MQYGSWAYGSVEIAGQISPLIPPVIPVQRFALFIAGVEQTNIMMANTLTIQNPLSQPMTCSFRLEDPTGTYRPSVGQEVAVYSNQVKVFGGTIEETTETAYQALPKRIRMLVKCTDFSAILDRRIVGQWFPGQVLTGLTTVVSGIVSTYLSADGIVYDSRDGDPGVGLGDQLFNWVTARQAFSQIANIVGWDYNVDINKVLRFFPKSTALGAAAFNIADNNGKFLAETLSIRYFRGLYRNRQYLRSSSQSTALWADIFSKTIPGPYLSNKQPPGGGRIAFITLYPINETPIVKVNGVAQRVIPITSVATAAFGSWDWYWIPPQGFAIGGYGVFQNQANAPLGVNDILEVDYQTRISPVTSVLCAAEIAARALIEGNSGYYDDVADAPNVTDPTAIAAYANGLLNRYGCTNGIPSQVQYQTIVDGLIAGYLQTINTSTPLVPSNSYLISHVNAQEVDKHHLLYSVTCDIGAYLGNTPAQFFAALVNRGQMPQPSNLRHYSWQFAVTQSGVANPGISSTGNYPWINVCQNPEEIIQYMSVVFGTAPATNTVGIQLLINSSGTVLQINVPKNSPTNSELRVYNPPSQPALKIFAGDAMQIQINTNSDAAMKDLIVTVVTSVVVT